MDRRHFLKGLIGTCVAASIAPSIFIPRIEPVRWKFARLDKPLTYSDVALLSQYNRAQAELWKRGASLFEQSTYYFRHFENYTWDSIIQPTEKLAKTSNTITFRP